jgi:hypothetical protein
MTEEVFLLLFFFIFYFINFFSIINQPIKQQPTTDRIQCVIWISTWLPYLPSCSISFSTLLSTFHRYVVDFFFFFFFYNQFVLIIVSDIIILHIEYIYTYEASKIILLSSYYLFENFVFFIINEINQVNGYKYRIDFTMS